MRAKPSAKPWWYWDTRSSQLSVVRSSRHRVLGTPRYQPLTTSPAQPGILLTVIDRFRARTIGHISDTYMIDPTRHTGDTPEHWESYAELLKSQTGPAPVDGGTTRMLSRVNAAITAGPRRAARWIVGPAVAMATVIAIMVLGSLSAPRAVEAPRSGVSVTAKDNNERPRQSRRQSRNRLPAPSIPSTPLPASADTALLGKPSHIPLGEPVGPGGNRAPRSGVHRQGSHPSSTP